MFTWKALFQLKTRRLMIWRLETFRNGSFHWGPKCAALPKLWCQKSCQQILVFGALFNSLYCHPKGKNGSVPQNGAPWKFNSWPLKTNYPKRKGSSSNQHFSGASCWTLGVYTGVGAGGFFGNSLPQICCHIVRQFLARCQFWQSLVASGCLSFGSLRLNTLKTGTVFFSHDFWKETVDSFEFLRGMICNKMDLCVRINLLWVWLVLVKIPSSWMETPYICSFGKPWRWVKGNISCYA